MKAYLWLDVEDVSDNYHDHGSALVIAETLPKARAVWAAHTATKGGKPIATSEKPTKTWTVADSAKPEAFAFPNAGCC